MMHRLAAGVAAAVVLAMGGTAQASDAPNRYGFDQIAAKNLKAAEAQLVSQRAVEPNEPSVLLNLAFVYQKTGRVTQANMLYNEVLAQPDVLMALGDGSPASSHAIARKAMGSATGYAAR